MPHSYWSHQMLMLQRKTSSDRKEDKRFQDFYLFENHIACSYVRDTSKKKKKLLNSTQEKNLGKES